MLNLYRLGWHCLVSYALVWPLECHLDWPVHLEFSMDQFIQLYPFFYWVSLAGIYKVYSLLNFSNFQRVYSCLRYAFGLFLQKLLLVCQCAFGVGIV